MALLFLPYILVGQEYVPLTVSSGFNVDVIAEDSPAVDFTTSAVDAVETGANFCFVSVGFPGAGTTGFPASGVFSSVTSSDVTFQLGDYADNNALRLESGGTENGTLTFQNQEEALKIYVLATGGSGACTFTGTITFTDDTTQAITTQNVADWYGGSPVAYYLNGRVNRSNNNWESASNNPRVYQIEIAIDAANQTKQIESIHFVNTQTITGRFLNIFGASAEITPDCPKPTNLSVSDITAQGATVNWESIGDSFELKYGITGFDVETEGISEILTTTSFAFTNTEVTEGQTYDVYVRQDCDADGFSNWTGPLTFTPEDALIYNSGDISTQYQATWSNPITTTSVSSCPGTLTLTIPAGKRIASISTEYDMTTGGLAYMSEQYSYIYSPELSTGESNVVQGTGTGGTMVYNNRSLDFAIGATNAIITFELRAFRSYGGSGCGTDYNKVDDGTWKIFYALEDIPACLEPHMSSLNATNITANSADLSWTSDGTDFDIIWGEEGFDIDDNEGTLEEGFTNGGTLSNLTTDTTYEFYVRQDCGTTDGVSMWSGPFSFTPQYCTPSYSNPSSSHRITNVSIVETSFSDSPTSYTDRDRTSVDVPSLNAGEEYTVTATVSGWTSVGVAIDFNQNGSFEEDERVALPEYIALELVTYTMTIEIPVDIFSGNYRMRVWQREANSEAGEDPCGSYGYGTWADYLVPIIGVGCPQPQEVTISDISIEGAVISWDAPATAPANGYNYEVRTSGNPGEATGLVDEGATTTQTATITGLDPDTTYQVYVQSVCDTDDESSWTTAVTFTTLCEYPEFVSATPGEVCGIGTATISADFGNNAIIRWYDSEEATTHLHEGDSFTTPVISTETIFYAEARTADGCVSPRETVLVTIAEAPDLTLSETETEICVASSSQPVTITSGEDDFDTFNWYPETGVSGNETTGWVFSPSETTTYTLTASQSDGPCSESVEVVVIVNSLPEATNLEEDYLVCPGTAQLISTGTADGYDVVWAPFDNLFLDAGATTAYNGESAEQVYFYSENAEETMYEVVVTSDGGCEAMFETAVTVPEVATPDITEIYLCVPTPVQDAVSSPLNLMWFDSIDAEDAIGEFNESGIYYVLNEMGNCQSERIAVDVTVEGVTTPTGELIQQFCDSATIEDLVVNHTIGSVLNVYENATGGTALSPGTDLFTGTFYISEQIGDTCESDRLAVQVTITQTPPAIVSQTITICGYQTLANVEVGQQDGTELLWYANSTTSQVMDTNVQIYAGTYYVSQKTGICESARAAITFVVNQVLPQPSASSQTFCSSAIVADLVATGEPGAILQWFASATSTIPLDDNEALSNGTYYVSQTMNGCESNRKAISVQIVNTAAPQIANMSLCEGTTIAEIEIPATTGVTYKWYISPTAITALPASTIVTNSTYYISKVYAGCESERVVVDIETTPVPNAPTGEPFQSFVYSVSINEVTVTDLVANEDGVLWFAHADDAATLTNPLQPDMPLTNDTTYYGVIVSDNDCVSEIFTVTVTVTLGNERFDRTKLNYYPNPAQDVLNIEYTDIIENVEIYNTVGQLVKTQAFDSNYIAVDMSSLSSGTYLLKLQINGYQQLIKVMKK